VNEISAPGESFSAETSNSCLNCDSIWPARLGTTAAAGCDGGWVDGASSGMTPSRATTGAVVDLLVAAGWVDAPPIASTTAGGSMWVARSTYTTP
jgi:hypothetical protein